jgi:demethylmenaquinone methyltransferase/2-methoxy-6-polyprenyl-1,4-benzoquinol methylase
LKPGDSEAVEQLFNDAAPSYDRLNDWLSLGLHRQWKRQMVLQLSPQPGERWLDLCCGTGDLALTLARHLRPHGEVLGIDAAAAPLAIASDRSALEPWLPVRWLQGDALSLDVNDDWADGAVMAYGLRNLSDPAAGLRELLRVLRPGGRAGLLDFNRLPPESAAATFQRFYLRQVVVPVAARMGLEDHYAYLEASLERFPNGREQERMAFAAGFKEACHRPVAGGLMGLLIVKA